MTKSRILILLLLTVLAVPSFSKPVTTADLKTKRDFAQQSKRIATATANSLKLVAIGSGGGASLLTGNPAQSMPLVAESNFTNQQAVAEAVTSYVNSSLISTLGLPAVATPNQLVTIPVSNTWHSAFEVTYNGIPLRDRRIHIHTGMLNGKIVMVRSNIPAVEPNTSVATLSGEEAFLKAQMAYSNGTNAAYSVSESPKLLYVNLPSATEVRLAYETIISDGFHQWRYTVDAQSGAILEKRDMVECNFMNSNDDVHSPTTAVQTPVEEPVVDEKPAQAQSAPLETLSGRVLARIHPNSPYDPQVTLGLGSVNVTVNGKSAVTDSTGKWSVETSYPVQVKTAFSGPYFQVVRKDGKPNGSIVKTFQTGEPLDVLWDSTNSDDAERNSMYSVALARFHVISVDTGVKLLTSQRTTINVNIDNSCNAFYGPGDNSLNFFVAKGGCSNTALVSDVVAHEYGHRINHVRYQVAGAGYMNDASLNEGFADLSSNFLRDDPIIGRGFSGKNTTLRNSNNTRQWPSNISGDGHETGTIISGAIWDYRKLVGHDIAEAEYNLCGYQAPDGLGFNDPAAIRDLFLEVLSAMILSDDDNNNLTDGTPHGGELLKAFQLHNLGIQNYFAINIEPTPDQPAGAWGYPVKATVSYNGPIGRVNPDSVLVHYSIDNGATYKTEHLYPTTGEEFAGSIPRQPQHKVVKYYITAGTNYTGAGVATNPMVIAQAPAFAVSFEQKYFDDCETDKGFTKSSGTATAGKWVLAVPEETDGKNGIAQLGENHTPGGSMCWVTGNTEVPGEPTRDYVTGGTVTLTSNLIDFTTIDSPAVRFWYFFSNDQGATGLATTMKVTLGTKTLLTTQLPSNGWKPILVKLGDIALTPAKLSLKVTVSDAIPASIYPQMPPPEGTITEAGIDDIEVLGMLPLGVRNANISTAPTQVYPNPVRAGESFTLTSSDLNVSTAMRSTLFNELGQQIELNAAQANGMYRFKLPSNLATGAYQLTVTDGTKTVTTRVVIW